MRPKPGSLLTALALLLVCHARAAAHEGPPYPILVDKSLGPASASVWGDPDVGVGTFFIILEPAPGTTLPEEIKVEIAVRPVGGRLPEAVHAAEGCDVAVVVVGPWHVRVMLHSPRGGGEISADVEVTPPGLGRWDLLIYLFPFLLIGALWLRAVTRRGRGQSART